MGLSVDFGAGCHERNHMPMKDRDVIKAFVDYLRQNGRPGLQVERWPEDETRESKEIDAVAGSFAIEHTSIDSVPSQRRDSDWFMRVAGGLERELDNRLTFRLRVTLKYEAVMKGQNWPGIRQALKNWITTEAAKLEDGRHVLEGIPGMPFRLHVSKASDRAPGLYLSRLEPSDTTLPCRMRNLFNRKANKLAKYQGFGKKTVLLVENDDIALMNKEKMFDAIRKAYPDGPPEGVDQIWYADTSISSEIVFRDFTPGVRQGNRPIESSGCGKPPC